MNITVLSITQKIVVNRAATAIRVINASPSGPGGFGGGGVGFPSGNINGGRADTVYGSAEIISGGRADTIYGVAPVIDGGRASG